MGEVKRSDKMKLFAGLTAVALVQGGYQNRNADKENVCDYEKIINDQISREMDASLFYYALQLKFSSQSLNRPNFAKMLGERAAEERDHGHMLAEFQQSRGYDVELKQIGKPNVWTSKTIGSALDAMIAKETELTKDLMRMHTFASEGATKNGTCDCSANIDDPLVDQKSCQAPHLADLMTSTYLPEQRKDINELKVLQRQLQNFGSDELMFDRLLLD